MDQIGKLIDDYQALRDRKCELESQSKELTTRLDDLSEKIMVYFELEGITKASGQKATAYIRTNICPQVIDKESMTKWVVENGRYDLLQSRVNSKPIREMLEQENTLPPGVEVFTKTKLNIRRK